MKFLLKQSKFLVIALLLLTFVGSSFVHQNASALSGSSFNASDIASDYVFTNTQSMTTGEIQQFLNAKVPTCDTNGTQYSSHYNSAAGRYYTRAEWGSLNGNPAPFTCLKNYSQTVPAMAADAYCQATSGGAKSAAQIITDVANACFINPQTILVLLQKEQGLVTDDWPWTDQYDYATGYACPDTASCDPNYTGFFKQVYYGARQYRIYTVHPDWYNYLPGRSNKIYYNPNTGCGSTNITIVNQSTANLYNYTPYQPNKAALDNLYGEGDSCSSYGNRNFWRIFNDWFGTTIGPFYYFKSAVNPPARLGYGETAQAELKVVNNSTQTWYSDGNTPAGVHPFRIMMRGYIDNAFADPSDPAWLGTRNQIRMVEPSVAPGQTATFDFRVKAPNTTINYNEMNMVLVQDGVAVHEDLGLQFRTTSVPDYSYRVSSVDCPTGMLPGDMYRMVIKATNTGTKNWFSDTNLSTQNPHPVRLATDAYKSSPYAQPTQDPAWLGTTNQVRLSEAEVKPGETGTFSVIMTAPYKQVTDFNDNFILVLDGVKGLVGPVIQCKTSTPAPSGDYSFVSATNPPAVMKPGQTADVYIKIKNTGNMIWRGFDNRVFKPGGIALGDMRLITAQPGYRDSLFATSADSRWLGTKSQVRMKEGIVVPGQTATFEFTMTAPSATGKYIEYFRFAVDGTMALKDIGLGYPVTVTP